MNGPQYILTIHLVLAILFFLIGWPLSRRKIGPNKLFGFRTPATIRDERIWYPVNESAGLNMMRLSTLFGVVTLSTYHLDLGVGPAAIVNSAVLVAGLLVMTVRGFVQIHQLKRQFKSESPRS